ATARTPCRGIDLSSAYLTAHPIRNWSPPLSTHHTIARHSALLLARTWKSALRHSAHPRNAPSRFAVSERPICHLEQTICHLEQSREISNENPLFHGFFL